MAEKDNNQANKKPGKKSRAKKETPIEKNPSAGNKKKNKDFLVVGIGASAGGVKALQDFFATMPPNSGMAFVVILHLSPKHESNLAGILQSKTTMPVVQVRETHRVEPDHVYVIPPNQNLEMVDGVVRAAAPDKKRGLRVAIDVFFRTLAEAYERNAVCVVLSGTGADGTLGLKRIKESNGFAIVQKPADAEFEEMPRNAIATGLADWILPVAQMPEKLISFRDSSKRLHLTDGDTEKVAREIQAEQSLREILTLLRIRTGHDFSNYKTPTLVRRIARHLQIHELEDIPTYLAYLREHPEEIVLLQRNLLINVTNFFRDKEAFDALENKVIPTLFDEKTSRDTVRVWSAGCASGEEAYSLAILLYEFAEKLDDPPKLQVFATDVDDEAIAQARENFYSEAIKTDVSEERLKRFFVKEGSRYRVKNEIREMVLFAPHNLLRDPPFSKLDLIVCRNVLIYLNRDTQERVMEIFHFALNSGGYLFLGTSESAESVPNLFTIVDKKHRVYSRRRLQQNNLAIPRLPVISQWQIALPTSDLIQKKGETAFSLGEVHHKLLEKIAPPSVLLNEDFEVLYMSEDAGRYMQLKGGELSRSILKLVNPDLLPDLRAALFNARREQTSVEFPKVHAEIDGERVSVNLVVRSIEVKDDGREFLLVVFDEAGRNRQTTREKKTERDAKTAAQEESEARETVVNRLEEELQRTKENLRATIEQHEISIEELKATNEELQAINEELRSASEELETSKEEAQSVNEELTTVNSELKEKIDEATRINSDLQNLMSSTDIATIFLDKNLRIKRYTPLIEDIFNITHGDIGRPLEHFTHKIKYENLAADAEKALRSLKTIEREIADNKDRSFLSRFVPYRTIDDRIDGVVLNFIDITERKQAEKKIAIEREYAESIVQTLHEPLLVLNPDLTVKSVNPSFYEHFDVKPEETIGRKIYDLGNGQWNIPALRTLLEDVLPDSNIFNDYEVSHDFEDIGQRVMLLNARRLDHVQLILLGIRDITDRKQANNELLFQSRLLDAVEQSVIATDLEGKITFWNRYAEKLFGWKAEEVVGRKITEITTPDDDQAEEIMSQLLKGKSWSGEFTLQKRDGTTFPAYVSDAPVFDGEGNLTGIIGVSVDVTERRKAEDALRKSQEHLNLILESTKDYAIVTFDLAGRITRWNAGAERIFGWTEKEAVGQTTHLIFTPEDRAKKEPEKEMANTIKNGRAEDERWHVRRDGSHFFASGVMQILRDGEVEGFVKIARDETDRLKAETALRDKKMLELLVNMQEEERRRIAREIHDHLGQQLTVLRLKLEQVKKKCEDEEICGDIEEVQNITEKLDRETDFLAWELRPAALDDLGLRVTLANFVKEWSSHTGIRAEFHTSGLPRTNLEFETETNLYRIAQEALNNVYKHAKAKTVSVLLEKRGGNVSLIIEDDGVGFNPADKRNRTKGIGLVGMNERAKILGGKLEIESQKGKGTTVFVRVPAKKN